MSRRRLTADAMAVNLLLAGDQVGLQRLAAAMRDRLDGRVECPACGSEGPHDDNGSGALCCSACGEHFDLDGGE